MGGFTEVFRRLAAFDLDSYVAVVGLGKKPQGVEQAVYGAACRNLTEPLARAIEQPVANRLAAKGRQGNSNPVVNSIMAETSIEWTDATWNPVAGCTVLTAGCTNCYAMRMAARLDAMGQAKYKGLTRRSGNRSVWTGKSASTKKSLAIPASWSKAAPRVRQLDVRSFSFGRPRGLHRKVWAAMAATPHTTYQIPDERPDRMVRPWLGQGIPRASERLARHKRRRWPRALATLTAFEGTSRHPVRFARAADRFRSGGDLTNIHWAIVGGESGPQRSHHGPEVGLARSKRCAGFRRRVFFQAVGRQEQEGYRPDAARPNVR